jgi:capsular polysaccharide transport system permease protein
MYALDREASSTMASVGIDRTKQVQGARAQPPTPSNRDFGAAGAVSYLRKLLFFAPSLFALIYFGFVAHDRYVSEAQFVIRTASRPVGGGSGLGSFLQMAGLGRSQDDVFAVQSFLGSSDAVRSLAERLPVREYYGFASGDPIARYPSFIYGSSLEELHRYLSWMITTAYSTNTGIMTLRVEAFRAQDAKAVADTMLELSEQLVNRMNARINADAVRLADEEVKRNEDRLVQSQVAITRFRNTELMIDPAGSSVIVTELIARLAAELAQAQTQLREMAASAPDGPLLSPMRRRIVALENQIDVERRKISEENGGLARKLAQYERLVLEREFAKNALQASVRALESARTEARRQQLYLERITQPAAADHPISPQRLRLTLTVIAANLLGFLVGWLIYAGVEERLEERRRG